MIDDADGLAHPRFPMQSGWCLPHRRTRPLLFVPIGSFIPLTGISLSNPHEYDHDFIIHTLSTFLHII